MAGRGQERRHIVLPKRLCLPAAALHTEHAPRELAVARHLISIQTFLAGTLHCQLLLVFDTHAGVWAKLTHCNDVTAHFVDVAHQAFERISRTVFLVVINPLVSRVEMQATAFRTALIER